MSATASRRVAHAVMRRVFEEGAYADRAFRAEADRASLGGRDRAFAMRLSYGAVQMKATLDFVLARVSSRPLEKLDPPVLAALRLGLYQALFMGGTPDRAAVAESVELVKRSSASAHGFVNAVLRRAVREGPGMLAGLDEETPAGGAKLQSHPLWIAERWWSELGPAEARALMRCDNEAAESAVRVNELKVTSAELLELLGREGVEARPDGLVPEALVLEDAWDVHGSEAFERGLVMPQSRASMLVARVLDPQPGERVLDLCAAPGAKTTHVAALMRNEGSVVAVEADTRRAEAAKQNCERLGASVVEVVAGDAAEPAFGTGFDRVLVDPPCSDLGTLQSRPDVRWRKTAEQVDELGAVQGRILDAGAAALRPGGKLVYSTCTVSRQENEVQMEKFLERHPNFRACDLSRRHPTLASAAMPGALQTLPHRDQTDGFFIAALERES